jgi:geranylgeranyl diphosphate synthase type I
LDDPVKADSDPRASALSSFASEAGLAFQIRDDLLGVFGDEAALGKPICSDLTESKPTTLLLDALKHLSAEDAERLSSLLGKRLGDGEIAIARDLIERSGAAERAERRSNELIASAKKRLDELPDGGYKELLLSWADFLVSRKF